MFIFHPLGPKVGLWGGEYSVDTWERMVDLRLTFITPGESLVAEEAHSHLSLAEVGTEEFLQKLTSQITEMVSAKISQGEACFKAVLGPSALEQRQRFSCLLEDLEAVGGGARITPLVPIQPNSRCLEVTAMKRPRHHLLLLGMAGHVLPPVFKSPPQSQRMGTPVVR